MTSSFTGIPSEITSLIFNPSNFGYVNSDPSSAEMTEPQFYKDGLSISLVCKDWTDFGQALIWRNFTINIDEYSTDDSEIEDFDSDYNRNKQIETLVTYPHLAQHVKNLRMYSENFPSSTKCGHINLDSKFELKVGMEMWTALLRSLSKLEALRLENIPPTLFIFILEQINFEVEVLPDAEEEKVGNLKTLEWEYDGVSIEWDRNFFLNRFITQLHRLPLLKTINIFTTISPLLISNPYNNRIASSQLLSLNTLNVTGYNEFNTIIITSLLNQINSNYLTSLKFTYQSNLFPFLFSCPLHSLKSLSIQANTLPNLTAEFLSNLVQLVIPLKALHSLNLIIHHFLPGYPPRNMISALLEAIPSSVVEVRFEFTKCKVMMELLKKFWKDREGVLKLVELGWEDVTEELRGSEGDILMDTE